MPDVEFVNLFAVSLIAFGAPLLLGLVPAGPDRLCGHAGAGNRQ
jgi:hypothetical protein